MASTTAKAKATIMAAAGSPLKPRPLYKKAWWWISFLCRQTAFILCLMPAYCVFGWHYFMCDRIAVYYKDVEEDKDDDAVNDNKDNGGDGDVTEKKKKKKPPFFSRNYLDVYGSKTTTSGYDDGNNNTTTKKPVVIFIVGGAWTIGYKMWGCLLARALVPFGILVIIPDYRNYPSAKIDGMVHDVDTSVQWVMDHAEEYGGDCEKVVLIGQSAGAHLGMTVVARKVLDYLIAQHGDEGEKGIDAQEEQHLQHYTPLKSTYQPQQIRGYICTSGPLNMVVMREKMHNIGMITDKKQMKLFGGEDGRVEWSPYHLVQKCREELLSSNLPNQQQQLKDVFPNICIVQGTGDKTVPLSEATAFLSLLSSLDIPAVSKIYEGWSHTDPILEKPMMGDHLYHSDVYELVCLWTTTEDGGEGGGLTPGDDAHENKIDSLPAGMIQFDARHPKLRPICPSMLVKAARYCNPF